MTLPGCTQRRWVKRFGSFNLYFPNNISLGELTRCLASCLTNLSLNTMGFNFFALDSRRVLLPSSAGRKTHLKSRNHPPPPPPKKEGDGGGGMVMCSLQYVGRGIDALRFESVPHLPGDCPLEHPVPAESHSTSGEQRNSGTEEQNGRGIGTRVFSWPTSRVHSNAVRFNPTAVGRTQQRTLQNAPAPPVGSQHSCHPTVKLHILPLV